MMPLALKPSPSHIKLQTKRSTWTPLNHPLINSKVFEERRSLVAKWFGRWSDGQRKAVLQDFVLNCSVDQLRFLSITVSRQLPLQAADFTNLLPRALCLYIFSFLDPRSLCRCAQVRWHWKTLVELDQLWMPKCLRLNWCISSSPSPFEQGVWKRLYVQTVQELRLNLQQMGSSQLMVPGALAGSSGPPESAHINRESPSSRTQPPRTRSGLKKERPAPPPWRDCDKHPKDMIRFNYLDNLDPAEPVPWLKTRSTSSTCSTSKTDDSRRKRSSEAAYKLRKAKSLMFLTSNSLQPSPPNPHHQTQTHLPSWTSHTLKPPLLTQETASIRLRMAQWNAGIRPKPVRTPWPRLSPEALRASQRSQRSLPSSPLFTQ